MTQKVSVMLQKSHCTFPPILIITFHFPTEAKLLLSHHMALNYHGKLASQAEVGIWLKCQVGKYPKLWEKQRQMWSELKLSSELLIFTYGLYRMEITYMDTSHGLTSVSGKPCKLVSLQTILEVVNLGIPYATHFNNKQWRWPFGPAFISRPHMHVTY